MSLVDGGTKAPRARELSRKRRIQTRIREVERRINGKNVVDGRTEQGRRKESKITPFKRGRGLLVEGQGYGPLVLFSAELEARSFTPYDRLPRSDESVNFTQ
jgi:hypothetical protein